MSTKSSGTDDQTQAPRGKRRPNASKGNGAAPAEPVIYAPSQEPLSEILTEVRASVNRHLILPEHADAAIALWCAHTYAMDVWQCSPPLAFMAPERECGKSKALEVIALLAREAVPSSNISGPAIFRMLGGDAPPTLLIDEVDTFLDKRDSEICGILNGGHSRAMAYTIRCVGEKHEPTKFSTWGAKALAGIGKLPDTLASRSLKVQMRRRLPTETVQPLRGNKLDTLRKRLGGAVRGKLGVLKASVPAMPEDVIDRDADNWEPLLAIADVAGGEWPRLARDAATGFCNGERPESLGESLLRDIKAKFDKPSNEPKPDKVFSKDLVKWLLDLEGHPWVDCYRGKEMTPDDLARRLAPYGIRPKLVRIGTTIGRGYEWQGFDEVWSRYL